MPNHKAHCWLDRQLFGVEYPWVHTIKDLPVRRLGFKHRTAMHDSETASLLFLISGNLTVYLVSTLHDIVDKVHSYKRKTKRR